jgi:VCBS repeat protein
MRGILGGAAVAAMTLSLGGMISPQISAAIAGLPFVEEFETTDFLDATATTARWSTEEVELTLAFRETRFGGYSGTSAGSDVTSDANPTYRSALGDINGDGLLDLVVVNRASRNRLYLNDGVGDPWDTASGQDIGTETDYSMGVALGDVDGDGDLDLVVGNYNYPGGQPNRLYLNSGDTATPFNGVTAIDITSDTGVTTSVALGDMDNDGDLDLVTGEYWNPCRIYLNTGRTDPWDGVTGADITSDSDATRGIALGDLNGDGFLDLVAANEDNPDVSRYYLNNGTNLPFSGVIGRDLGTENHGHSVGLGDLDGDGDLDAIIAHGGVGGGAGQINRFFLNDGDSDPFNGVAGQALTSDADHTMVVALGDVDCDGDLDVIFGNGLDSTEINRLYLNTGTSTPFQGVSGIDLSSDSYKTNALSVGDVDGNGDVDVITGNGDSGSNINRLYLNPANGNPWNGVSGLSVSTDQFQAEAVALGDLNGDGHLDAVFGGDGSRVYLNNTTADPWNGVTATALSASPSKSVVIGDVDGDGDLDVVEGTSSGANRVYRNDGTGTGWTGSNATGDANHTLEVDLGDLDNDGDLDLVASSGWSGGPTDVYLNDGTGDPWDTVSGTALGVTDAWDSALGDVDSDGDLDIVVAVYGGGVNLLYTNDGTGSFGASTQITSDTDLTLAVALGDLDGDGDLDAVFANGGDGNGHINRYYLNDGVGDPWDTATARNLGTESQGSYDVELGDVDGDGDLDALVFNRNHVGGMLNQLYLNTGGGDPFLGVSGIAVTTPGYDNKSGALGDVDRDGDLDLVEATVSSSEVNVVWLNQAADGGGLHPWNENLISADAVAPNEVAWFPRELAFGDVDGDGDPDMAVAASGPSGGFANRLYLNNGTDEPWENVVPFNITSDAHQSRSVDMGDVDNDGDIDIVVGNYGNGVAEVNRLYRNDGTGTGWTGSNVTADLGHTNSVVLGDMNSDGHLDVVAGNYGNERNRVYLNDASGDPWDTVSGNDITATARATAQILVGDVDNDGDLDVVSVDLDLANANQLCRNDGTGLVWVGSDISTDTVLRFEAGDLGDVDSDGDLDLVVTGWDTGETTRLYLNDGVGDPWDTLAGIDVTTDTPSANRLELADLDQDGDLDLVIDVQDMGGGTRQYFNDGNGDPWDTAVGQSLGAGIVFTNALSPCDANGDGQLETLLGLNQTNMPRIVSFGAMTLHDIARGSVQSLTTDSDAGNIPSVLLTAEADVPDHTSVDFWVSNNGGAQWFLTEPGSEFTFPTAGSDLRWRADLHSSVPRVSPTLHSVRLADPSVDYPTLVRAQLIEDAPADGTAASGEAIVLVFDREIDVTPTTVQSGDFYLTQGTLGSTLDASPTSSTQAVITLGSSTSGIEVGVTQMDIGSSFRTGIITDTLTSNVAEDSWAQGVDDAALTILSAVGEHTTAIQAASGGTATVDTDTGEFAFTRHALSFPAGAIAGSGTHDMTMGPVSAEIRNALALPSAVAITISPEVASFSSSATLTLQFDPDAHDRREGYQDWRFEIVQIAEDSPGVFSVVTVPGTQEIHLVNDTVSVPIDSLDPAGALPGVFATLPVEPINERSIHIGHSGGAGGGPATLDIGDPGIITPETYSEYQLHQINIPGWEVVAPGTPGSYRIDVRTPVIWERVTETGQSFPYPSAAIFVIETRDDTGTPAAFPDPVDIQVQFIDRGHNPSTDVLDFNEQVGYPWQMRIVRDTQVGFGVDFQQLPGSQTVNQSLGTVSATSVSGLTNSTGVGIWGVVVDPIVIPVELSVFGVE